jgi:hypothetical protein
VYETRDGSRVEAYQFPNQASLVNDVVVTRTAADFTDSLQDVLYRLPLSPDGGRLAHRASKSSRSAAISSWRRAST